MMTLEQQQALALAQARRRRAEAEGSSPASQRPDGMAVFNEGIARGLGTPVDLTTAAINAGMEGMNALTGSTLQPISEPFGGSDTMRDIFQALGVRLPEDDFQPEGVVENLVLGSGNAAGAILPANAVGRVLQAGTGAAKAVGEALVQPFATAPVRAVASEVAAGGGAGVGMDVAEQLAPGNPLAEVVGAVVGGGAAGVGPAATVAGAKKLPGVAATTRFVQSELAPFTQQGAMERARNRMANLVEDAEAARAALSAPTIANLSPAVSTGDRRLMALEQTVRDTDPAVDMRMRQLEAGSTDALRREVLAPANGQGSSTARAFMGDTIEQQVDGVGQALNRTFGEPTGVSTTATNLRVASAPARRTAYDAAYEAPINYASDAGTSLQELLGRVEQAAPGTIALANRMMAGEGLSSRQIKATIGEDGTISFQTLPDTRQIDYVTRAMNQMADGGDGKGASGGPNDWGRIIGNLSRDIRSNLKEANPLYATALQTAATPLGQRQALLLGQELLNPSLPRDVAADRLADLTAPEMDFVRQGVRAQMDEVLANVRATIANPDTGLREAQRALTSISSRAVREKIGMILPKAEADAFFAELDGVTGMIDPYRSGVARFASGRPGEEIRSILDAPNPGAAAAQLVAQAGTDPTGNALSSVKGGFLEELLGRARSGSFGDDGGALLSGRAMQNALADTRMAAVGNAVLSGEERDRLQAIIGELSKLETARGRLPSIGGVMEGEPNSIVSMIARTIAARTGAHAGRGTSGASLLTAHFASERMKRLLETLTLDKAESLIRQAVAGDRELFDALLTPAAQVTSRQENRLANALSVSGVGAGAAYSGEGADDGDDPMGDDPMMQAIMRGAGSPQTDADSELERYLMENVYR